MTRRRLLIVGVPFVAAAGLALVFWVFALKPAYEHREWSNRVKTGLTSLLDKRPADVPPGEWEFLIGWTLNLHGNCGSHRSYVDAREMWPFSAELERRLQGPFGATDIDWVWDEYARFTTGGRLYSDKYRPTRSPNRKLAGPGYFGFNVK